MKLSEQSLETSKHIETSDKLCANLLLVGLVACRACLLQPDDQRPRCHNPIHNQHHTNHGDRSVSMHGKWALKEGELQNKASKPRDDRLAEDWKRLNNLINSKTEDPWYSSTVDRDHLKAAFDPHGLRIIWTLGVGGIPHQQNGWTKEHMGNQNRTPWQNKSFRLINISPYRVRERNANEMPRRIEGLLVIRHLSLLTPTGWIGHWKRVPRRRKGTTWLGEHGGLKDHQRSKTSIHNKWTFFFERFHNKCRFFFERFEMAEEKKVWRKHVEMWVVEMWVVEGSLDDSWFLMFEK